MLYDKDTGSPASNLLETKVLINSIISDTNKGARFVSLNIKDYFLATPIRDPEYIRAPYKYFLLGIRNRYRLDLKVTLSGYIFSKIKKDILDLK